MIQPQKSLGVKWDAICKPKDEGGLGVKDWDTFNLALLGKWRWKFLRRDNDLCSKVIWACYGNREVIGGLNSTNKDSPWWRDLFKACYQSSLNVCWFDLGLQRKIGCGNTVRFWKDEWCGNGLLKIGFSKLFHLSIQKNCTLMDMVQWVNGHLNWNFKWRRTLSMREDLMVEELRRTIGGLQVQLHNGISDSWLWTLEPTGTFTVHSAYNLIKGFPSENVDPIFKLIWGSRAPSNVCVFAWRLLLDRLPTKSNLLQRRALPADADLNCIFCMQETETANHLFVRCPFTLSLWTRCYRWFGGLLATPGNCRDLLLQFIWPGLSSKQNAAFRMIWFAMNWSLWMHRNGIIFNGGELLQQDELFDRAQIRVWHWLSGRITGFHCSLYEWISQPILCLQAVH